MHFIGDLLDAVLGGPGGHLLPVGHEHFVPLVLHNVGEIVRPGAGNPVGGLVLRAAAGAAGESDHAGYAQLFRQQNGVDIVVMENLRHGGIGVHRVAVGGKSGDFQTVLFDGVAEFFDLLVILEQLGRVAVRLAGEAARTDFNGLNAGILQIFAGVVQASVRKQNRKNRKLHLGHSSVSQHGMPCSFPYYTILCEKIQSVIY